MRRILFTICASAVVVAPVPAVAMAHGRHSRHHHGARAHHVHRAHTKRFGHFSDPSTPSTSPSPSGAGTVASFDSTDNKLTIMLADGSTVSGTVTRDTEIECKAPDAEESFATDDHGGRSSGEDSSGDDSAGEDAGEDDGGAEASCSSADLKPGATVLAARLEISSAGSIWDKVELAS